MASKGKAKKSSKGSKSQAVSDQGYLDPKALNLRYIPRKIYNPEDDPVAHRPCQNPPISLSTRCRFDTFDYAVRPKHLPRDKYDYVDFKTHPEYKQYEFLFISPGMEMWVKYPELVSHMNADKLGWHLKTIIDIDQDCIYFSPSASFGSLYAVPDHYEDPCALKVGVKLSAKEDGTAGSDKESIHQIDVRYFVVRRNPEETKRLLNKTIREVYDGYKEHCKKKKQKPLGFDNFRAAHGKFLKVYGSGQLDRNAKHICYVPLLHKRKAYPLLYDDTDNATLVKLYPDCNKCPLCGEKLKVSDGSWCRSTHWICKGAKASKAILEGVVQHCAEQNHKLLWYCVGNRETTACITVKQILQLAMGQMIDEAPIPMKAFEDIFYDHNQMFLMHCLDCFFTKLLMKLNKNTKESLLKRETYWPMFALNPDGRSPAADSAISQAAQYARDIWREFRIFDWELMFEGFEQEPTERLDSRPSASRTYLQRRRRQSGDLVTPPRSIQTYNFPATTNDAQQKLTTSTPVVAEMAKLDLSFLDKYLPPLSARTTKLDTKAKWVIAGRWNDLHLFFKEGLFFPEEQRYPPAADVEVPATSLVDLFKAVTEDDLEGSDFMQFEARLDAVVGKQHTAEEMKKAKEKCQGTSKARAPPKKKPRCKAT